MVSSFKIGSVMGIPIRLHITFLLILPFLAYAFALNPPPYGFSEVGDFVPRFLLGLLAAVLLFVSVLVHEIAHSYVAKKNGTEISGITLYLFGGVSSMEEIPKDPHVELRMALVGPLTSIFFGIVFGAVYVSVPAIRASSIAGTLIFLLAYLNILLGIFNILPGFPMDGGRVLRAFLATRMPFLKATRYAVEVGKIFAFLLGALGLFMGFHGIWLIIIAFFIYIAAGEEERSTLVSATLEGIKVRDIMTKDVVTIDADATISQCIDTMFRLKHLGYPVLYDGQLVGIVTLSDVLKAPADARETIKAKEVMTKDVVTVKPDDDAYTALQVMSRHKIGRLVVMEGRSIAGIVSRTDLLRSLELYEAIRRG